MLEVGNIPQQYNASVNDMDQSHFSAWVVVSAPLILGFDLTNNTIMDRVVMTGYYEQGSNCSESIMEWSSRKKDFCRKLFHHIFKYDRNNILIIMEI